MLDFPLTIRLREDEERAIRELVEREPLVAKTTMGMGCLLLGLSHVRKSKDGFQQLLQLLRQRAQAQQAGGAA